MAENGEIRFRSENIFAGNTGVIDGTVIRGVSVITGDQVAEGHGLTIDDTTLKQLQACAKDRGKVPVCLDHGSGVKDLNGYLTGFRLDASGSKPKIRADWHLLETHPETATMLEKAEKMPDCFGLSVAFKGPPKGVSIGNGKMAARCEKLLSVDCVTRPAANTGLFSVPPVDKTPNDMAKENDGTNKPVGDPAQPEPTMADIMEVLQHLNGRLDQHEQFLGSLQNPQGEENQGPTLEQYDQMSDEELAQHGLTRAEVDQAVQEVIAAMEADQTSGQPQGENGAQTQGELVGAGAPGGGEAAGFGGGEAPATYSALSKRVVQLESRQKLIELRKKQEAEEVELKSIEDKVMILATQRDEAIQFAENLQAENDALRMAVRTGTRPVAAGGGDDGVRLFGANDNGQLHEFQARVKQLVDGGKSEGQAIQLAVKENPARHADYVASLANKRVA